MRDPVIFHIGLWPGPYYPEEVVVLGLSLADDNTAWRSSRLSEGNHRLYFWVWSKWSYYLSIHISLLLETILGLFGCLIRHRMFYHKPPHYQATQVSHHDNKTSKTINSVVYIKWQWFFHNVIDLNNTENINMIHMISGPSIHSLSLATLSSLFLLTLRT